VERFWDLLQESVILSGLVALALVFTCCYLMATGQPVPELLAFALTSVLGYFFGAKVEKVQQARRVK